MADDIQAFGPAQELRTHTPVTFAKLPPNEEGRYDGPTLIDLLKKVLPLTQPSSGNITLDPSSPNFNYARDTRHEAIHSLLMNQPAAVRNMAIAPDIAGPIARQLLQSRTGMNTPDGQVNEIPAYMGAYDKTQSGVPQDWRAEYIGKLQEALFKINPKLAKTYGALSK